jgi:SAM-dependent methyltransferase
VGIDLHNLGLLAHAQDLGVRFDRTVGIGRQAVFVDPPDLERHRALRRLPPLQEPVERGGARYFEPLMRQWFGAEAVDSVDASPYEQATLLHDMNLAWPPGQAGLGSYDAVLDLGCLEHVFDFPVAWRNCVALCRVGGHLLHALPANNLTGHGFYQFSPELFFNLYQEKNGFALSGVWFALKEDLRHWWRVADPAAVRRRVTLRNAHETYLLVVAKKLREPGPMAAPQQSDYAQSEWLKKTGESPSDPGRGGASPDPAGRTGAAGLLDSLGLIDAARGARARWRAIASSGLSLHGPDYGRIDVATLLRRDLRA